MSKDKRAEIVEAMAREMCRTLAPCASMVAEIMDDATYLRGHEGDAAALTLAGQLRIQAEAALDIAGKAFAEIADAEMEEAERIAAGYEENSPNYARLSSGALTAFCIKQNILALTSKGVKE